MPDKDQSTTVINTDEIARKLEAAYGIKSGSIYISTIVITNANSNVDVDRRRPQPDMKENEICDQLGSVGSLVEITMYIVYPAKCGVSMACKKELVDVIQALIEAHISSISLKFKFDDENFSELALIRCKTTTDSSLNTLLRLRRDDKSKNRRHTTTKRPAATKCARTTKRTTTTTKRPTATKCATTTKRATTTTTRRTTTKRVTTTTKYATTTKRATTLGTTAPGKQLYVS
ncbi:unnamed protein product [Rotaria sp. Silwood2]|nr:unnamed protein product [Rotaria sp. Silwood2]CAF3127063.1 unnamed protein product [Rotaria sp. Silwood2]CAF4341259.1 unnamed protein product [Rotaria sp. Silwood2]CAF4439565.1 unnamed protein product [Rotaria sp. Silwood2]